MKAPPNGEARASNSRVLFSIPGVHGSFSNSSTVQ